MDSNVSRIKETHHLLDKIEESVKHFIKHKDSSAKTISFQLTTSRDDHLQSQNNNQQNMDQLPTIQNNNSILREIQEIDNSYRKEIDTLKNENQSLKHEVSNLKQIIQNLQLQQTTAGNENKSNRNSSSYDNNFRQLQLQLEDEKQKSEFLKQEIEIKNKPKDLNSSMMMEQMFKKMDESQQRQMQQNEEFMKCILQIVKKPEISSNKPRQPNKKLTVRRKY